MPIATLTSMFDQILSATAAGQENLANLETSEPHSSPHHMLLSKSQS
jgi:hypothetical protein